MRNLKNIILLGLLVLAILLLVTLVDCSGDRPRLEQSTFPLYFVEGF